MLFKSFKLLNVHIVLLIGLTAQHALRADEHSQETSPKKTGIRGLLQRYPILKYSPLILIPALGYGVSRLSARRDGGVEGGSSHLGPWCPVPAIVPDAQQAGSPALSFDQKDGAGSATQDAKRRMGSGQDKESAARTIQRVWKAYRARKGCKERERRELSALDLIGVSGLLGSGNLPTFDAKGVGMPKTREGSVSPSLNLPAPQLLNGSHSRISPILQPGVFTRMVTHENPAALLVQGRPEEDDEEADEENDEEEPQVADDVPLAASGSGSPSVSRALSPVPQLGQGLGNDHDRIEHKSSRSPSLLLPRSRVLSRAGSRSGSPVPSQPAVELYSPVSASPYGQELTANFLVNCRQQKLIHIQGIKLQFNGDHTTFSNWYVECQEAGRTVYYWYRLDAQDINQATKTSTFRYVERTVERIVGEDDEDDGAPLNRRQKEDLKSAENLFASIFSGQSSQTLAPSAIRVNK